MYALQFERFCRDINNFQLFFFSSPGIVNPRCPRTQGPGGIHQSHLDVLCVGDFPLPSHEAVEPTPEEAKIGELIATNLVADGATLQMGESIRDVKIKQKQY